MIIAGVAFGVGGIAKKNTCHGPWCELMRSSGSDASVAQATEDAELGVGRWRAKQEVMRCEIPAVRQGRMLMSSDAVASASGQKRGGTLA